MTSMKKVCVFSLIASVISIVYAAEYSSSSYVVYLGKENLKLDGDRVFLMNKNGKLQVLSKEGKYPYNERTCSKESKDPNKMGAKS